MEPSIRAAFVTLERVAADLEAVLAAHHGVPRPPGGADSPDFGRWAADTGVAALEDALETVAERLLWEVTGGRVRVDAGDVLAAISVS